MPDRCRVGLVLNGKNQYYQREQEQKRNDRWVAVPYFVPNSSDAAVMSEFAARALVAKLQALRQNPWIEDVKDGRRLDNVSSPAPQQTEDNRTPMRATLDDENSPDAKWYLVRPICRPTGRVWFLKCAVPGRPTVDIIYHEDVLGCLQRAQDIGFLLHAERIEGPTPPKQPAVQNQNLNRSMIRPGDRNE
jgi:hypothetical protein